MSHAIPLQPHRVDENDREEFFQAYVECALWSSTDDDGEPLDGLYGPEDIAAEALDAIRAECEDFLDGSDEEVRALETYAKEFGFYSQAGHDFWLTRNGHGAGFWDRTYAPGDLYDACQVLTRAAKAYGESILYVGDDGLIYVH